MVCKKWGVHELQNHPSALYLLRVTPGRAGPRFQIRAFSCRRRQASSLMKWALFHAKANVTAVLLIVAPYGRAGSHSIFSRVTNTPHETKIAEPGQGTVKRPSGSRSQLYYVWKRIHRQLEVVTELSISQAVGSWLQRRSMEIHKSWESRKLQTRNN